MNLFVLFSFLVTFACGWLNVEYMLGFAPYLVSHQTGNATRIAIAITSGDLGLLWGLIGVIVAFIIGSALAGFINPKGDMNFTPVFGICYIVLSVALFFFAWFTGGGYIFVLYGAFMSGYQNGFMTQFKIRVSHLSGISSDAGIELGRFFKVLKRRNDRNKKTSLIALGSSFSFKMLSLMFFVLGALLGAFLTGLMPWLVVLMLLSAFNVAIAFVYFKAAAILREDFTRKS